MTAIAPPKKRVRTRKSIVRPNLYRMHLNFLRGYLDGLPLEKLGEMYIDPSEGLQSLPQLKARLSEVRRTLTAIASRHGRDFRDAFLLTVDPERLRGGAIKAARKLPTLDEFREQEDPYEYYSERELLQIYAEKYPPTDEKADKKARRNADRRRRQIAVLSRLEGLLDAPPKGTDNVAGWLDVKSARALHKAGIQTLNDIIRRINERGFHWYADIPRLGAAAAKDIVDWMMEERNKPELGSKIHQYALVKPSAVTYEERMRARPKQTGIVPLEAFIMPAHLTGDVGHNRAQPTSRCQFRFNSDVEAAFRWLATHRADPTMPRMESNTIRVYRKEVERYLLFSVLELGLPLADHTPDQCDLYQDFLFRLNPETDKEWGVWPFKMPREAWLADPNLPSPSARRPRSAADAPTSREKKKLRSVPRWDPDWRPFHHPLSDESRQFGIMIVKSFCKWLTDIRYLDGNPWVAARKEQVKKLDKARFDRTRSFTFAQWRMVLHYMRSMPMTAVNQRTRFALLFLYGTGLRLSEITGATLANISPIRATAGETNLFQITVKGKGGVGREVPIPTFAYDEMCAYLGQRGINFAALPENMRSTPLLAQARRGRRGDKVEDQPLDNAPAIDGFTLYSNLKDFFLQVANSLPRTDLWTRDTFLRASTHWLRHTCGTHALLHGAPMKVIQTNFGHKSIETTAGYLEPDNQVRAQVMNQVMDAALGAGLVPEPLPSPTAPRRIGKA